MLGKLKKWVKTHVVLLSIARSLKRVLFVNLLSAQMKVFTNAAHFVCDCIWLQCCGRRVIPRHLNAPGKAQIVMLVWAYLPADPRVEREARALASNGFEVKVICPEWSPPSDAPYWGPGIEIQLLASSVTETLTSFPWVISDGMLKAALAESPWAYHAHDLNMAMIALKAAALKGALCVCDFHEWYSENVTYDSVKKTYVPHSLIKRSIYQFVEH